MTTLHHFFGAPRIRSVVRVSTECAIHNAAEYYRVRLLNGLALFANYQSLNGRLVIAFAFAQTRRAPLIVPSLLAACGIAAESPRNNYNYETFETGDKTGMVHN